MSTTTAFNSEMKNFLTSTNNEVTKFINEKYRNSESLNYKAFFDNFLFDYGLISFNCFPLPDSSNKYIPYVTFTRNNIFNNDHGNIELSNKAFSLNECERAIAKYLIEKLSYLNINDFLNWHPDSKYDIY